MAPHPLVSAARPWSFPAAIVPVLLTAAIVHKYAIQPLMQIISRMSLASESIFNLSVSHPSRISFSPQGAHPSLLVEHVKRRAGMITTASWFWHTKSVAMHFHSQDTPADA